MDSIKHTRSNYAPHSSGISVNVNYSHIAMISLSNQPLNPATTKLKVLLPTPLYGGSLPIALHVADALTDLGHDCRVLNFEEHYSLFRQFGSLLDGDRGNSLRARLASILGDFAAEVAISNRVDLVWFTAQSPVTVDGLRRLRSAGIKTAFWFVEDIARFEYWRHIVREFDNVFTIQSGASHEAILRAGAKSVEYLPCAANPKVHRPIELLDEELSRFGSILSFVGAGYPNRQRLFDFLQMPDLKIWGNDWPESWVNRLQESGRRVSTEETVKIFCASSVNLNIHSSIGQQLLENGTFVNPRTFEIASCGAFQIVDEQMPLKLHFAPDEMTSVRTVPELVAAIELCLKDPEMRKMMSAAARRRVLKEHTYAHRMRTAISKIFGPGQIPRTPAMNTIGDLKTVVFDDEEFLQFLSQFDDNETASLAKLMAKVPGRNHKLSRVELMIMLMNEFRHWGVEKGVIQ